MSDAFRWTLQLAEIRDVIVIHVFPDGDSDRHDKDATCRCKPRLDLRHPETPTYDHNSLSEESNACNLTPL